MSMCSTYFLIARLRTFAGSDWLVCVMTKNWVLFELKEVSTVVKLIFVAKASCLCMLKWNTHALMIHLYVLYLDSHRPD